MTDPVPDPYAPYAPYHPGGYSPFADPLIPPPSSGVGGWFNRVGGVFRRSWKQVGAIFALTHLLPGLVISVVGGAAAGIAAVAMFARLGSADPGSSRIAVEAGLVPGLVGPGLVGLGLVAVLVSLVVQFAGYGAATYAVTREAAGSPVRLGQALGYGFRRSLGLLGWQVLTWLLLLAGFAACVLPGFYVFAATALVGPVFLFERARPIGRSVEIFNRNLGRVLGRLALILVALLVGGLVSSAFESMVERLFDSAAGLPLTQGLGDARTVGLTVGASVAALFGLILQLPITMLQFAGILVTYTEQRGFEGGAGTPQLAAELG